MLGWPFASSAWAITDLVTLSLHDALPILRIATRLEGAGYETWCVGGAIRDNLLGVENHDFDLTTAAPPAEVRRLFKDRKSTRLNSSHLGISYAVFCLKKKSPDGSVSRG